MKKKTTYFFLFLFIAGAFSYCNKYEEGHAISFRSKKCRLVNTWKTEFVSINGVNYSDTISPPDETYFKDYRHETISNEGTWEFNADKTKIILTHYIGGTSTQTLTILKLTRRSFWYSTTYSNQVYEIHLVSE